MDTPQTATPLTLAELLAHYETSHRHAVNEAIHLVAIPVIMFSLVGLMYSLHAALAGVFLGASLLYYLRLRLPAGRLLAMVGLTALMLALALLLGEVRLRVCGALFLVGWVAQFIGHRIEGRKPSFLEDIRYLWIGPLFVLDRLARRLAV